VTRRTDARARLWVLLCALTLGGLLAVPGGAAAETMSVNSTNDAPLAVGANGCVATPPDVCTLRAAIQRATANGSAGAFADDVIMLPPGLYQLTATGGASDPDEGDLDVRAAGSTPETLTIVGTDPRATRIVGGGAERVLESLDSNMSLNITGVTIAGGRGATDGGGILSFGNLALGNSAVVDNEVQFGDGAAQGAGIFAGGTSTTLTNVEISNNRALDSSSPSTGGGVYLEDTSSQLLNVTISGNSAFDDGGGLYFNGSGTALLVNVTIAGNTTVTGTGGGIFGASGVNFLNTIVGLNRTGGGTASNCAPTLPGVSAGNNLEEGSECLFTASGDRRGLDPQLGPLAPNDGPTDTRALLAGSPAIDTGSNSNCPSGDQRGKPRPQGAGCDIGAFEVQPSSILPPPPPPDELDPPVLGRTVNVTPVSGEVFVKLPPGSSPARAGASQKGLRFRPLREARQIPVRSFLNTKRGTVRLTSARNTKGATQSGTFAAGVFQILQSRKAKAKGLTELRLKGSSFRSCKPRKRRQGKRAQAALSKKAIRRLRSNAGGRFRTRGRFSAATVRGTKWLTVDRCDGTLTKVTRGRVAVRDFRRKKTVLVKRGKSYLAKAPG